MKKLLFTLAIAISLLLVMAFAVCAEEITVVDGTDNITLGDCVIEGLDRDIPDPSSGFTFVLDTETKTAKITAWAYSAGDAENGVNFVIPSSVKYNGETYAVTSFNRVTSANNIIELVAIPDTVTAIPNNAFDSLRALRYVYVGSGVETVGSGSFQWCGFTGNSSVDANGEAVGNIRDFIWKTKKITTLTSYCFHHIDFNVENTIEFPFDKITTYESNCLSYNPYAFQTEHNNNRQLYIDVFDLRKATSVSSDAFTNAIIAKTIIVSADQVNALSPQKLRGGGTAQVDKYCDFIICGGETPETAITLTAGTWTANAWYWYPGDLHFNIVFRGYVNAYDGVDGLENQNGYGSDVVDYFFDSEESFRHYIDSIDTTTERVNTYTRYAKNTNGYFNVCVENGGVHSFKAYNLAYTPASEGVTESVVISEYTQTSFKFGYPTYDIVLDDDCTASNLCWVCDFVFTKGLEHEMGEAELLYPDGYTNAGVERIACVNDGCTLCNDTEIPALFTSKGYSKDTNSNAIVLDIKVDNEAVAAYETYLKNNDASTTILYGVVVAIDATENKPLNDDATAKAGALAIKFNENNYTNIQIKITGIDEANYETGIYCSGYMYANNEVTYINGATTSDVAEKVTYASLPSDEE